MSATPSSSGETPQAEVPKFRPRACARCSQSKLKCNWVSDPGVSPCERCARTKSDCVLPSIKPRGPRRGNSTRVGQLEQKLDGIMSLLSASQHIQNAQSQSETSPLSEVREVLPPLNGSRNDGPFEQTQSRLGPPLLERLPPIEITPPSLPVLREPLLHIESIEIIRGLKITYQEADHALDQYRTVYSPYFPFVPISGQTTAYDLYHKQPFLFRTIIQVSLPQSPQVQMDMKRWFREYIAQHMIIQQERRLELLQAILVFSVWGDHGFYLDSKATNFLQLATGLVIDLGLNKLPNSSGMLSYSLVKEAILITKGRQARQEHTLEEMRALLGCFAVNSLVSCLFRRMHNFPFTNYLNHCCEALQRAKEYQSDTTLLAQVGLQRLLARIHSVIPNPDTSEAGRPGFHAPLQMSIKTLRKEMDALMESHSHDSETNIFPIWVPYHGALIRLYEPAIYMRPSSISDDATEAGWRTECLWNCLQAVISFVNAYLAVPLEDLGALPFIFTSHMSFAMVTASRLMFLEDSDWDVSLARRSLEFSTLAYRLEERIQAAELYEINLTMERGQFIGRKHKFVEDNRSMLATYRDKIRWIRQWYTSKVPEEGQGARDPRDAGMAGPGAPDHLMDIDSGIPGPSGEMDAAFWQAMLDMDGSWGIAVADQF